MSSIFLSIIKSDWELIDSGDASFIDFHRRGKKIDTSPGAKGPKHGAEYFFSNFLVKVWQLPNFFIDNSVEAPQESHTFIVMVWEKSIRKRVPAYSDRHFARLEKTQKLKYAERQFEFENLESRETRTIRFCKYFLSLYDLKTTVPFT